MWSKVEYSSGSPHGGQEAKRTKQEAAMEVGSWRFELNMRCDS